MRSSASSSSSRARASRIRASCWRRPSARGRRQLSDRIADLGKQFEARIRDANVKVPVAVADLAGVPEDGLEGEADATTPARSCWASTPRPCCAVLERADAASTRELIWRAKQNEGGAANLALLGELAQLRREYARLFGMKTFADFQLRRRMVENSATADALPRATCQAAVQAREVRDLDELRDAKARHLGTAPATTRLERWDVAYYTERLRRERYSVDQEAFRPYFPAEESLSLRDADRRADARRALHAGRRRAMARRRSRLRGQRREERQAAGDAVRRPLPARGQVQPRRGLAACAAPRRATTACRRRRWSSTSTARG